MSAGVLKRGLTPLNLFAIAFGSIIGIGWITLVGDWLQRAGPVGAVVGFGLGCLAVTLVALAYAEMALMIPEAGAEVAYAGAVFGRDAAFFTGWMLLLVYGAVIGFEMISMGWVLSTIAPALRGPVAWSTGLGPVYAGELAAGFVTMAFVLFVNIRGASLAASTQLVLMALKVGVSLLFIAVALVRGDPANLQPAFGNDAAGPVGGVAWVFAIALLFYAGFNFLPQALEERAEKVGGGQIVAAMLLSLWMAFAFYALVVLATAMTLPRERFAGLELPAAAAFEVAFGSRALRDLVLVAGLIGLVTAWNGTLFAAARIALLLGRRGLLPATFGVVSERGGTPVAALLAISGVGALFAIAGRGAVAPVVTVAATCIPLAWVVVCAAALVLRLRDPGRERPFGAPGGAWTFASGLIVALAAFAIAAHDALTGATAGAGALAVGGWLTLGLVVRLTRRRCG